MVLHFLHTVFNDVVASGKPMWHQIEEIIVHFCKSGRKP